MSGYTREAGAGSAVVLDVSFTALMVARYGRPMERALIRARQRYDAERPTRSRLRRMHSAYGRGWR